MDLAPLFLSGACLFVAVLAFLNWVLYRHAWALTHLVRQPLPEPSSSTWKEQLRRLLFGFVIRRPNNPSTPADVGLPYETHQFYSSGNQLSAWHLPQPWRRGMVLLFHGYRDCKADLLAEAEAFHEMGYACFLIDFPGSGDSQGDTTTIGHREAQDVARAVNYVRDHWQNERLILFGASMGAAAILRAIDVHHIKPDSVILECPFDRMIHAVAARCQQLGVAAMPTAALLVFWGSLRLGFNGFRHNPAEYARRVCCPVLLMHGTLDAKAPRSQVEAIYANLPGDKMMVAFDGLEHGYYVETQPEEWKQQVRRFLLGKAEVVVLKAS